MSAYPSTPLLNSRLRCWVPSPKARIVLRPLASASSTTTSAPNARPGLEGLEPEAQNMVVTPWAQARLSKTLEPLIPWCCMGSAGQLESVKASGAMESTLALEVGHWAL